MKNHTLLFVICLLLLSTGILSQSNAHKARTIITTDGEIDDVDSFIRMLLYSNEFEIEGLIYSSSMWHYKGDGKGTKMISEMEMTKKLYGAKTNLRWAGTHWMDELINAYEKIYPHLILHAKGFPNPQKLRSLIKVGNIDFEGDMEHDTEGSDFIKKKLLDNNPAPIYLQAWGGTNTIARALKSIEEQYKNTNQWDAIYKKICDKVVVFTILDQDATYRKYVAINWPKVKIYYNAKQFWCLAYNWKKAVPKELHSYLEGKFMRENIIQNHGALTKMYYSYGDGQKQVGDDEHIHGDKTKLTNTIWGNFEEYDFISEGDSPAFLHLINVGLDNLENPQFGGWGGRLVQSTINPNRWEDGEKAADFNPSTQKLDLAYPQIRWIEALQNDFAARADWCVKDYQSANHPPVIKLNHSKNLVAKPNTEVVLGGNAQDPDGNNLKYHWWQYKEVGTYKGQISVLNSDNSKASFQMPVDIQKGETIHIILEVSDSGKPQLTRYQRVIIECK
jgi:hypothetical protein